MSDRRFQVITVRRTARFTSYGIYDNERRHVRSDLPTSRDRKTVEAEVKRLNDD